MSQQLTREQVVKDLFDGNEQELVSRFAEVAWAPESHMISLDVKGSLGLLTQIDAENFTLEIAGDFAGAWR